MTRAERARLPEVPDGTTLSDAAAELSERLGRPVTAEQLYYLAYRKRKARLGRREVEIVRRRMVELLVVPPGEMDALAAAFVEQYGS